MREKFWVQVYRCTIYSSAQASIEAVMGGQLPAIVSFEILTDQLPASPPQR